MSRTVRRLGERKDYRGNPGIGLLVAREREDDIRTKEVFLTEKGRLVARLLIEFLEC